MSDHFKRLEAFLRRVGPLSDAIEERLRPLRARSRLSLDGAYDSDVDEALPRSGSTASRQYVLQRQSSAKLAAYSGDKPQEEPVATGAREYVLVDDAGHTIVLIVLDERTLEARTVLPDSVRALRIDAGGAALLFRRTSNDGFEVAMRPRDGSDFVRAVVRSGAAIFVSVLETSPEE